MKLLIKNQCADKMGFMFANDYKDHKSRPHSKTTKKENFSVCPNSFERLVSFLLFFARKSLFLSFVYVMHGKWKCQLPNK